MAFYVSEQARLNTVQSMLAGFLGSDLWVALLGTPLGTGETVTLAQCLAREASFAGYAR